MSSPILSAKAAQAPPTRLPSPGVADERAHRMPVRGVADPVAAGDMSEGLPVEAEIELGGRHYRVVLADGVPPRQVSRPGSPRPRHLYCEAELAHFRLGDHCYALLPSESGQDDGASLRPDPRQVLTNRELQIVQLICMGLLTKQVADRLHLSEFTVRSYLKTIYCKLGVRSRGGMVYTYSQVFGLVKASNS